MMRHQLQQYVWPRKVARGATPTVHKHLIGMFAASVTILLAGTVVAGESAAPEHASAAYRALSCPPPTASSSTWKILDRDGANRKVTPYLSSLGQGESGTGIIVSPDFAIAGATIAFTICGHDGPQGKHLKNFIALVDAKTGKLLRKTSPPRSDALQSLDWDVRELKGRAVRIELHDGDKQQAFAWFGIGKINASPAWSVDFSKGLPAKWTARVEPQTVRTRVIQNGIPFLALASHYTIVPTSGAAEIPCGITIKRLFILGCTVARGLPLRTYGHIEVKYRDGSSDWYPLMYGYTLEGEAKRLSRSSALQLHRSGDPFQYYLVIRPKAQPIESIVLAKNPRYSVVPRITAVTCETASGVRSLLKLPDDRPSTSEQEWIKMHQLSEGSAPSVVNVNTIRQINKLQLEEASRVLRFRRTRISTRTFESASACDVNKDGEQDIVSGGFWYAGPSFSKSHKITDVKAAGEYWSDFADYPMDVNGDGWPDLVTGAFFGQPLRWLENPGAIDHLWVSHTIAPVGPIETVRFWDIDGDGVVEVVPNAGGNVIFFRLILDKTGKGTGQFTRHEVKLGGCGHGLGFGDINGDGHGDFVVPNGWLESPSDPLTGKWTWHDDGFRLGLASVPILVFDVNEDRKADLIVGQAHNFGLDWFQQKVDRRGKRTWLRHPIDRGSAQLHDIQLADIDHDGKPELLTGKRYRAHNGHDPGSTNPLFVRYFDIDRGRFACHTLDYGPPANSSGVGIYFWVDDVDSNGWPDIVAPGKEGLYLFRNLGE